jgi:hypothetical protein
MYQLAERILRYLPPSAVIRAKVYPVIKPGKNSFVWEASSNPAIFLYLDPQVSRHGKFSSRDAIDEKGSTFFGAQGPWYTVGYKMAVMAEKRFGRPALIETMLDPRRLLVLYNQAAAEQNAAGEEHLPLWSEELLKQLGTPSKIP